MPRTEEETDAGRRRAIVTMRMAGVTSALPDAPPIGGVLETALYAVDLDAAEAFYGGLLGLPRIARAGTRHVFFRCGAGVLLVFNPGETRASAPAGARPAVPPHGAEGAGHLAFAVPDAALDAWARRLGAGGVEIEADLRWPNGARSLYVRDPAGNSVEFADPGLWHP